VNIEVNCLLSKVSRGFQLKVIVHIEQYPKQWHKRTIIATFIMEATCCQVS